MSREAVVTIAGAEFGVPPGRPFVFGRANADGVTGLDANDMGISAEAGSVEWKKELWWVVNRSRKRRLLLDDGGGEGPQPLACGQCHAIGVPRLDVLVMGTIQTHQLKVVVPPADLARFKGQARPSSGTLTGKVTLSDDDLDAVVALFEGYLEGFPRHRARPRTYKEAAERLGRPEGEASVRRRIDRLKQRFGRAGQYFTGRDATCDLADYLIETRAICVADLRRLPPKPSPSKPSPSKQ